MPTINADMEELIVYVPSSDWSSHEERVVERHYFERSKWVMDLGDLDQSNFLYQVLRNSWQMTPMTPSEIFNHLGEQFL
jgi:hypothetical protein